MSYFTQRVSSLLLLVCICTLSYSDLKAKGDRSTMPLVFRENAGQWDKEILFKGSSSSANVFFTKSGMVVAHTRNKKASASEKENNIENLYWKINFEGASEKTTLRPVGAASSYTNYLIGTPDKHRTNIPDYKELRYEALYKGIDLHYYAYNGELKYDFILSPEANIEDIRLNAEGINNMSINENGELEITHDWGTVLEKKPYSYQEIDGEKIKVDIRYEIKKKNTYGYKVYGKYDPTKTIIIDPLTIIWATYVGGNNPNISGIQYDIAVDPAGYTYGTGYYPASFPTSSNAFDPSFKGGKGDVFVYKMDTDGSNLIYATYVGGNDDDEGMAIAVNKNGEAYVAGYTFTEPSGFPTTKIFGTMVSSSNAFVFKLNSAGTALVYSVLMGGNDQESALDLALNSSGEVIVVGETKSYFFPMAAAGYHTTYNGGIYDGFYVVLNTAGSAMLSSGFLGGANEDRATGVAVDSIDNIYITGYTESSNFPTSTGAYDNSYNGNLDVFVLKFNSAGTALQYSTFIGGAYDDAARAIDVTPGGEAVITGYTFSTDYPKTDGSTYKGLQDVILSRLNTSGSNFIYSKTLGGSQSDIGTSLVVDTRKNVFLVGMSQSTSAPDLGTGNVLPFYVPILNGAYNVFFDVICEQGIIRDSNTAIFGGTQDDYNTPSISVANKAKVCNAIIGFTTHSTDLSTTTGVYQGNKQHQSIHDTLNTVTSEPALYNIQISKTTNQSSKKETINVCGPQTLKLCYKVQKTYYCDSSSATICSTFSFPVPYTDMKIPVSKNITITDTTIMNCMILTKPRIYVYLDTPKAYISKPAVICIGKTAVLRAVGKDGELFKSDLDPSVIIKYRWSTGDATDSITIRAPGKYWLRTSNDCFTFSDTIIVTAIDTPIVNLGPDRTLCFPGTTLLNALNANDTIPTSYRWNPSNKISDTISVNQPGKYCVTKTNQCGTAKSCITINPLYAPKVNLGNDTSLCNGSPITLDAGNVGATYLWSPGGQTSQTISVSSPGSYSVVVTNSCGTGNDQVNVTLVATPPNVNLGANLLLCSPGSLPHTLDAGNPGSNYYWSTGSHNETISVSTGGQYFVTVTNGCGIDRDTITITTAPALGLNLRPDTALCGPASLLLNAQNAGSTFLWSPGGQTTQTKTVSTSGNYSVTVTNACGTASDNINVIIQSGLPIVNLGADKSICTGTATLLNAGAAPGQTYLWSTGATTSSVSVSLPTIYWVDVTNACGTKRDSITLSNGLPSYSLGPDRFVCAPATVSLSAAGAGTVYHWSTSSSNSSITVSNTGIYWVDVFNTCGVVRDSIFVSIGSANPTVNLGPDQTLCATFSTVLNAGNPGATYLWSPGGQTTQTITVSTGGQYSVKVTNGCGANSDTILIKSQLINTLGPDISICQNTIVILNAGNPGATYLWSPGGQTSQTISINTSGTYGVTVTNACGSISNSINVGITASMPAVNLGPDIHVCAPASVLLDAGNVGATYLWSTGAATKTISVSSTGKYFVRVSNACGISSDTIQVTVDTGVPVVNLGADQTLCQPVFLVIDAGAGATSYSWNTGAVSRKINVTSSGNYSVTVTNACGNASDNILITAVTPPAVSLKDTGSCITPITLNAGNAGSSYFWTPGGQISQTISASMSGLYALNITNACGLFSEGIQVVINTGVPSFNLGADTNLCTPAGLLLNAGVQPGGKFLWSPSGDTTQTLLVKHAGSYSATVVNYCGSSSDNIVISANPIAVNARFDDTICIGSSVRLYTDSLTGYTYSWSPISSLKNPFTPSPTATPVKNTLYYINTSNGTCNNIDSVDIVVENPASPDITISPSAEGYVPLKITFNDKGNVGVSYVWNFDDGDTSHLKNPTHTFTTENYFHVHLIAITDKGCKSYDSITVKAFTLFIPNLITPNGDGRNDHWELTKLHELIYVEIYNRWGERVYVQDGYTDQWDGANLSDGIYYYLVKDQLYDKSYKGWVEILRSGEQK